MPIRSSRAAALLWLLGCASAASAHDVAHSALPAAPGLHLGLEAAGTRLSAPQALPSKALPGYLMQGDPGVDRRGTQIEHATASLGWRPDARWGAELALGAHGSDPVHVEAARVTTSGRQAQTDWTVGAGRQSPAMGALMGSAGHLDRYTLMPLAKQVLADGDWIEDGVQGSLTQPIGDADLLFDFGLWSGRTFPGSKPGAAFPSLHVGVQWDTADAGDLSLDLFAAQLKPQGRGARASSFGGGHSHSAPRCDTSLVDVVCFDGRSRLAGLGAQWSAPEWPVTLSGAVMWRQERGSLQSRNGDGRYTAHHRGEWVEASVRPANAWDVGLRHERLSSRQTLVGPGATLVANEAALTSYRPLRRTAATLGWQFHPAAALRLEGGRDAASGGPSVHFVALRLLIHWEHDIPYTAPAALQGTQSP